MSRTPLLLGLPVALVVLGGAGAAPARAQDASQACDVRTGTNASLDEAKALYASACPGIPRRDCDPLPGGAWICSSGVVGNGAPKTAASVSAPAPTAPPAPAPAVPAPSAPVVAPPPPSSAAVCSTAPAATLGAARSDYAASCSLPRVDCDPLPDGRWVCSSARIENGVVVPVAPAPQPSAPQPSAPASPPVGGGSSIGRFDGNDLLALHYDNCPDRDDGHALVAGKMVVDKVGLSDPLVVNGTCGDGIRDRYQPSSEAVVRAVWGGNYLDAFRRGTGVDSSATVTAADRWAATIAAGGDVWVAEGGPSDFTARVLRRIGSVYPSVDRKRVKVVQHSAGSAFNESNTSRANIALVKSVASYIAIDNGNVGGNGTADLNEKSSGFVSRARSGRYASEWNAAFAYLDPNRKLDFSDTVELLYIIDDRSVRSVDDFARRYF